MKVTRINPLLFTGGQQAFPVTNSIKSQNSVQELNGTTPDFAVTLPQKYSKIGVETLPNGTQIHSYKLANGYRVSIVPMPDSPTIVKNYVSVGSLNETDDIKGISHFLEHMAFNGTTGENGYLKLKTGDSFKKIDKLGGWTNASTSYAVTDYVNSTPMLNDKDIEMQLRIIAGMTEDLALTDEMIEKEKGPVCSEINMILDDPQTIAIDQTVRNLFNIQSSADELVAGSVKHIQNLNRAKVKDYYNKYYTPDNMNLIITGNVNPDEIIELVAKNFKSQKIASKNKYEEKLSPITKTVRKDITTDKATSTDTVIGFTGPKNNDTKHNIIFEIVQEYLSSTDVGIHKELKDLNTSYTIYSEKISNNPNNPTMIFMCTNSSEKNSEQALKIIKDKLAKLSAPSEKTLENIKQRFLQEYNDTLEYSLILNDTIGRSILNEDIEYVTKYTDILKQITTKDIEDFIQNYLDINKSAITVVHPKSDTNNVSFQGKKEPMRQDNISQTTLRNGYKLTRQNTRNENNYFNINLHFECPSWANPAAIIVLDKIYQAGTINYSENNFNKLQEENNMQVTADISKRGLYITGHSSSKHSKEAFMAAKELLYNPRITEEEVNKAIKQIKDSINRSKDTANSVFKNYETNQNPLISSKEQILKGLENITTEDLKKLHQYILQNSYGDISINNSNNLQNNDIINDFNSLKNIKPFIYKEPKVYKSNNKPVVLTQNTNNSQADIKQTYKFKLTNTPKEIATINVLNTILSTSSIGLFNTLREKEHLAYSVNSQIKKTGDCGYLSCNILTTTDNKEINEKPYDNVQKSINGFHRQINCLINSEYTDEDLESAKRKLKASLLNKEGVSIKLSSIDSCVNSNQGLNKENLIYNEIDNLTRKDITDMAKIIFENPPIYTVVASQDTLDANKDYLKNLES